MGIPAVPDRTKDGVEGVRDYLITTAKDREILLAVASSRYGTWLPWRGVVANARRLAKDGLLQEAGISVNWPHTLYALTYTGREELLVAKNRRKA